MLLAEKPCPDQSDRRYVPVYDTSPENFRAAYTTWRRVASSDAAFVKTLNGLRESQHLWLNADETARLRDGARRDRLRLLNVSGVSKQDGSTFGADHILLMRDDDAKEHQYAVYVLVQGGQESIVGIAPAVR
jgi:hypothetical protein